MFGVDPAACRANRLVRSAVEREFITVGEAVAALPRLSPQIFDRITHARRIVDFRNQLTHEYPTVDDAEVWLIAQHDVPVLKGESEALLADWPEGEQQSLPDRRGLVVPVGSDWW